MATAKEELRERQLQELEAITSIFNNELEDLRPFNKRTMSLKTWKGPDIRISLTPFRESSNRDNVSYVQIKLHITCVAKYPKVPPKISLEESKGLSNQEVNELLQKLKDQAEELRGEEMIFELSQTVRAFLLEHNKSPTKSFYDEMVQENQKRAQKIFDLEQQKASEERQTLLYEVEKRKEMFMNEAKRRGEPRRSMSESNRHASSSESSDNSTFYRGHNYPTKCQDHRNSETLHLHRVGRQIQRGCCLGHSQKGCIAFTGIDIYTGQLLYVTEWNMKFANLEQSCNNGGKCLWLNNEMKCTGNHRTDDVIASIEKQVSTLSQLSHKNLIQFECAVCVKRKEGLFVYVVQDFLLGTSVSSISSTFGWCLDGARMVARGVLDALVFLHNNGVSHNRLLDSTVFMDNTGTIRCTDFSIMSNLLELFGVQRSTCGDLPALGALIEGLMSTCTPEMRDFINKCNSERTLSASELLDHPFLRASIYTHEDNENMAGQLAQLNIAPTCQPQRKPSLVVPPNNKKQHDVRAIAEAEHGALMPGIPSLPPNQSRLNIEFEILNDLGQGAFGRVMKVRNKLDNRVYAIKSIQFDSCSRRSRQLYKKMTREVELLSRLNHENVVRYFNSWIESCYADSIMEMDERATGDWSLSLESNKPPKSPQCIATVQEETEDSFTDYMANSDDSDSDDGIEFVDSDGKAPVYDDDDDDDDCTGDSLSVQNKSETPKPLIQIMYIQMEFCEKFTLRTAIDENLFENTERLWRLFREILEGLSHIHQQGIIHRDLKPVNIFLDSHDQIKIGDFGLATTSFLALQTQQTEHSTHPAVIVSEDTTGTGTGTGKVGTIEDATGTGKVGTTLYVAPELTGKASRSTYSQKVDMYTLGIILFEMCNPPFETGMERVQTMLALRSAEIIIPDAMLNDSKYEKTVKILRWLLNHDPSQRPTAEELLASDLIPPAQLEANELQEMLRHALANPQSKAYKHLVARCLQQESDEVLEHTYHLGSSRTMKSWSSPLTLEGIVSLNPVMEFVKSKVVSIFRKHGAIEVDTPLLSPLSNLTSYWTNPVRLMTHSGCVVVLPCDLRTQFARQVAMTGVNMVRRYCVDRVYREEKVFNFHPKQNYECAFDIITPNAGGLLVDAELLSLAFEITNEIPHLREKNLTLRMNHTGLLRAILLYCNVPKSMYNELFGSTLDFIEGRISKFQFHSSIVTIMDKTKTSASTLMDLLLSNFLFSGTRNSVDESSLRVLLRGKGEATSLANSALRELESIVALAQSLGVTCPIYVYPGLPISYERAASGGIVWQMIADLKPNRTSRPAVLAIGERYDTMLHNYQKKAQSFNPNLPNRDVSGAGLSFSLDKLVAAYCSESIKDYRAIDVGICISGTRPPLKDVTHIMRLLRSVSIRYGFIECIGSCGDEAQDLAKLGALHVILVAENGALRVRTWDRDRFHDRHVTRTELLDFIQKIFRSDATNSTSVDFVSQISTNSNASGIYSSGSGGRGEIALSNSSTSISSKNYYNPSQLPNVEVIFQLHEKLTANTKRRYENQVTQQMSSTLSQFVRKESFTVVVVEMPPIVVNAIVGAINPRGIVKKETEREFSVVAERYPKYKRYMFQVFDEIMDNLTDAKSPIVALYSISDSYYRVII